ncbi:LADA_0G05622g1_1 [Lachancea dasiensis]|uniref:LADA_0G05622g1_1 n=1 Tax=Lachancea dasiensis TaxID=1072105 RepID=A0A1G4JT87_9SACH|nr:LADA_0G05622g1_1 [Lachancea dasiensis]
MSIGLGVAIYAAVKPVLKIYVIIFVGFLLAKYNLVTVETSRGISNMVVNAILPCLTFNKIVGNISAKDIKEVGVLVLTAFVIFATGGVCAYLTKWVANSPRQWYWGLLFAGVFPNISDLPIAYVQSMSNGSVFNSSQVDRGVAYCCIFLTTQSFLMMNFGMFRIVGLDFREPQKDDEQQVESTSPANFSHGRAESVITDEHGNALQSWLSDKAKSNASVGRNYNTTDAGSVTGNNSSQDERTLEHEQDPVPFDAQSIPSSSLSSNSEYSVDALPSVSRRGSTMSRRTQGHSMAPVPIPSPIEKMATVRSNSSQRSAGSQSRRGKKHRRPSQTMNDVINEYSAARRIKTGEMDLTHPLSLTQEVGEDNAFSRDDSDISDDENEFTPTRTTDNTLSRTNSNRSTRSRKKAGKISAIVKRYKLGWLLYILINFCRPASLGALLGILCCMIPWVKALFVHTYVHVHEAPDGEPVLNFLMDFTGYIGNACVPLGLLLLGGTLARLEIKSLPKGFWKTTAIMTTFRLVILPIIGIAWADKLYDINWIENDIAKFVVILTWAMPSATAQVYFTAFYTPLEGNHVQMDCLSVFFMCQYAFLFITLSVVVSYALKADLKV